MDGSAPPLPHDFAAQLERLVRAGRRADAVELFLVEAAQASPEDVAGMRAQPFWPAMEAAAQSLAYEAFVMGPDNALPAALLARITQPTLVLNGGDSPAWMGRAGKAVAKPYPEPCTGCWRPRLTTLPPKPSSPNCWSSSSPPDEAQRGPRPGGGLAGQPDAEAGGGQLQQDLPGGLQGRDLGRAQLLQLGQRRPRRRRGPACGPGSARSRWPTPFPRLAQETLGAEPVDGRSSRSSSGGGPDSLVSSSSSAATRAASTSSIARWSASRRASSAESSNCSSLITATSACGRS